MFVALSVGFASCGDDEDEGDISETGLVGTWETTYMEGWYKDSDYPEDNEEFDGPVTGNQVDQITFKADGSGDDEGESFTWTLKGSTLTQHYRDYSQTVKVLRMKDKELIVESSLNEGSESGYAKITYKRIK